MKLTWSKQAKNDLNAIYDYYLPKSSKVAVRMYNTIINEAESLLKNPLIGKVETFLSTEKFVFRSLIVLGGLYKIIYVADKKKVGIYRVWCCRQNPENLKKILS